MTYLLVVSILLRRLCHITSRSQNMFCECCILWVYRKRHARHSRRLNKGFFHERTALPETDLRRYLRLLPLTKLSCVRENAMAVRRGPSVWRRAPYLPQETRSGRPREARSHTNASVRVLAVCLAKYPLRGSHHQLRSPCCRPPDYRRLTSRRLRYHLGMSGRARPRKGSQLRPNAIIRPTL